MSHYKPYPAYRDSGVEWIGRVPKHWARAAIKHILSEPITDGPHETPVFLNEGVEFLSVDGIQDGELVFEGKRFISYEDHARFCKKAKPQINDVLVGKSASVGKVARVKTSNDFNVWSPLAILRSDPTKCNPAYLEFALKADSAQQQILLAGNTSTQANIGMDRLASVGIPLPPITEQFQLTKAIEQETTSIDALITKKTRFIELLKEKRQALITHAVTKGLDPNVAMKDSGVEWIGVVPAHWSVAILKRFVVFQRGHDLPSDTRVEGTVPVVSSGGYSGTHNVAIAKAPGIVTGRYGSLGEFTFVEEDYWPLNTALYSIELHNNDHRFVWYLLQNISDLFLLYSAKAAVPGIDRNDIHEIYVAAPQHDEQRQIAKYLDEQCDRINAITEKTQRSIDLLKERRAAFITAAVTGQIDLRESA